MPEPTAKLKPSGKPIIRVPSFVPFAPECPRRTRFNKSSSQGERASIPKFRTREVVWPPPRIPPKPLLLQPSTKILPKYLSFDRAHVPDAIKEYIGKGKDLDRSQIQIIKKINQYIDVANAFLQKLYPDPVEFIKHKKTKLKEDGHCHGFNLYRAYLQDHGLLKDYDDMLDIIINCPKEKLQLADHVFEIFCANILRGQEPWKYFDAKYHQQSIAEILGENPASYHDAGGEEFSRDTLRAKLIKLLSPYSRAIFTSIVESADQKPCGHSISLVTNGKAGVDYFDPNFKSGTGVRITSYDQLMNQIWASCFDNLRVNRQDKLKLRMTVLQTGNAPQAATSDPKILTTAGRHTLMWASPSKPTAQADNMQTQFSMSPVSKK